MSRLFHSLVIGVVGIGVAWTSDQWQRLEECRWVESPSNDGDSFDVEWNGNRHTFRLYFIDCFEKSSHSQKRRAAQAACFGIKKPSDAKIRALATQGTDLARAELRDPFVVYTCWQPVEGDTVSYRAFVETADGSDLARLLVRRGLALVRETPRSISDHPNGQDADFLARELRRDETEAQVGRAGAWALSPRIAVIPACDDDQTIAALDRTALRARAGQRVRVCGRIAAVESRADGRFTMITFSGGQTGDLRLLIRGKFLAAIDEAFLNDLCGSLSGRDVEVGGMLTLFRGVPQIEIESADQLVVRDALAAR